jgi:hypothetical protein
MAARVLAICGLTVAPYCGAWELAQVLAATAGCRWAASELRSRAVSFRWFWVASALVATLEGQGQAVSAAESEPVTPTGSSGSETEDDEPITGRPAYWASH